MAATSKDWGRIAAEAGYYDQAHLIGDCRELAGLTPGAFRARQTARASRDYPVPGVLERRSVCVERESREIPERRAS